MTKALRPRYRQAVEDSETRDLLARAAIRIIEKEGIGAVTTARVTQELGLKRPTFHYYFGAREDLLVAALKIQGDKLQATIEAALQSGDPLDVLWTFGTDASSIPAEFSALALRSPKIGDAVRELVVRFRTIFSDALRDWLSVRYPHKVDQALAITMLIQFVSQGLSFEKHIGLDEEHDRVRHLMDALLDNHTKDD